MASSVFPEFKGISRPATCPAKGQRALNDIHFSHHDVNQPHTNIEYEPGTWASAGMTPHGGLCTKGIYLHNNDNCFSVHLCNCETFESGLVYTRCTSGRKKKFITCGSVYLIAHNPGLAISLLYFCFLLLNKPAVRVQESRIQNRREVAFRSSAI